MRRTKTTWTIGGAALVLCGVLVMLTGPAMMGAADVAVGIATGVVTDVLFAGAVLLFALGLTREGSVVAREPLGVAAMSVVALWPLASRIISAAWAPESLGLTWGYVALLIPAAAGLIAAVQIGRAGVVAAPWRWAPLWALAVTAASWAIGQGAAVAMGPAVLEVMGLLSLLGWLGVLAPTLGLGIVAIVVAAHLRPEAVEVYRSA